MPSIIYRKWGWGGRGREIGHFCPEISFMPVTSLGGAGGHCHWEWQGYLLAINIKSNNNNLRIQSLNIDAGLVCFEKLIFFFFSYTIWHRTGKTSNKRLNGHGSLRVYVSKKHPILRIKIIVFIISPILLLFFPVIIFLIDDNDLVHSISIIWQCFEEKTWSSMFLTMLQRNKTLVIIAHPYPILLLLLVIIFLIDDNDLVNSMSCLGPVSRPINGQDLPQQPPLYEHHHQCLRYYHHLCHQCHHWHHQWTSSLMGKTSHSINHQCLS